MTCPRFMQRLMRLLPAILLSVAVGCNDQSANRGAVGGHVVLDGKPVEQGAIVFIPIDGTVGVVTGGEIKSGRYQLPAAKGPAIGTNRVEIRSPRKTGKMVPNGLGGTGKMVEEQVESVAPRFNAQSILTCEIHSGDNTADFEVMSK